MSEKETLRVILVRPEAKAEVVEIPDELSEMQRLVGGLIEEYMPFDDDVAIVCNDEGKMMGLPLNRAICDENDRVTDIIAGDFFLCYAPITSEKFLSLPEDLEKKYLKKFEYPEQFFRTSHGILPIKYEPMQSEAMQFR